MQKNVTQLNMTVGFISMLPYPEPDNSLNFQILIGSLTILAGISYGEISTWVLCID
jgi:hypothetical protein